MGMKNKFIKDIIYDNEVVYYYFRKNNTRDKIIYSIYKYSSGNTYISYYRVMGIKLFGIKLEKKREKKK